LNLKQLTNIELIKFCVANPENRTAWIEFYNRFDERIWLVVYRECKAKNVATNSQQFKQIVQDLVQDVYLTLLRKNCKALSDFKGRSENSIYTYLGTIARNVVRNYITKTIAQKRPQISQSLNDVSGDQHRFPSEDHYYPDYAGAEAVFTLEDLREDIEKILNIHLTGKNKERNKLIFLLHAFEQFSPQEIASQLQYPLSAKRVGNIISEIKKLLRRELLQQKMKILY